MNKIMFKIILKTTITTFLLLISTTSSVLADCYYNGERYETGQTRNGQTCYSDGTWR